MFYSDVDKSVIQQCNAALSSFYLKFYLTANSYICIAKQNLKPNQFCKKLDEVIVILNRASSIDKHTKTKPKYLHVPAVARAFLAQIMLAL